MTAGLKRLIQMKIKRNPGKTDPGSFSYSENTHPAKGDINIITTEKQNELTDMSVALCSAGTMELSSMSDLIWIRSSANDVRNPPKVIRYQMPVNSVKRPDKAIVMQITKSFFKEYLPDLEDTLAPNIPPNDIMKRRGPNSQLGMPVIGSFACRKNSNSTSTAPTSAFLNMRPATFVLPLRNLKAPV